MASFQVATFEGYHPIPGGKVPRKRKGRGGGPKSQTPFAKATRACRKRHKGGTKPFWQCVSRMTKKKGARRRRKSRS